MAEVIYFDESEANLVKEAKSFSDMQYDDESASGAYGKLEEIQKKVGEITQVVESLEQGYNTLKEKYDTFTSFDEVMDKNTRLFKTVILNIEDKYQKLDKAIHDQVDEQVKLDTEHNEEIEELTQALNNEEAEGEGGDTPAGGGATTDPAAGGETAPTGGDTPTSGSSAADIADEVIQGKWGTGDARKAALEAAGYDPAEIQKIVNQKINGTYTGDTPSGGGGSSTPATETPTTETPTSGGGGGGGTTNPAAGEEAAPAPAVSPTFQGGGAGIPKVDENGYIVRQQSQAAQDVINKLYHDIDSTKPASVGSIRAQGTHSAELDNMIDNLSPEECAWVMSRIENDVYGQSDRHGSATPETDQHFIENQLYERFGGDIHNLLKSWGTYSYGGY